MRGRLDGATGATIVVPLLVGCFVVVAAGSGPSRWVGEPQDTLLFLSVYAYGLAGGLAALSAGLAGRRLRSRLDQGDALPGIFVWRVVLRAVARPLTLNLISLLAVWMLAVLEGIRAGGALPTLPPSSLLALPLVSVGLCTASGFAVGLLVRSSLALLPVAVAPYLTLEVAGQAHGSWWGVLPYIDEDWDPGRKAVGAALASFDLGWALAAVALLVGSAALMAPVDPRRTRVLRASVSVTVGAACVLLLSTSSARGGQFSAPDRAAPICLVRGSDQLCIWKQRARLLPAYETALTRVSGALSTVDSHPWSFGEQDLPGHYDVALSTVQAQPGISDLMDEMLQGVVFAVGDPRCGGEASQLLEQSEVFGGLLQTALNTPGSTTDLLPESRATLARLRAGSADDVRQWGTTADEMRCRPG